MRGPLRGPGRLVTMPSRNGLEKLRRVESLSKPATGGETHEERMLHRAQDALRRGRTVEFDRLSARGPLDREPWRARDGHGWARARTHGGVERMRRRLGDRPESLFPAFGGYPTRKRGSRIWRASNVYASRPRPIMRVGSLEGVVGTVRGSDLETGGQAVAGWMRGGGGAWVAFAEAGARNVLNASRSDAAVWATLVGREIKKTLPPGLYGGENALAYGVCQAATAAARSIANPSERPDPREKPVVSVATFRRIDKSTVEFAATGCAVGVVKRVSDQARLCVWPAVDLWRDSGEGACREKFAASPLRPDLFRIQTGTVSAESGDMIVLAADALCRAHAAVKSAFRLGGQPDGSPAPAKIEVTLL